MINCSIDFGEFENFVSELGAVGLKPVEGSDKLLGEVSRLYEEIFSDYDACCWAIKELLELHFEEKKVHKRRLQMNWIWFEGEDDEFDESIPVIYDNLCKDQDQMLDILTQHGGGCDYLATSHPSHHSRPGHWWEFKVFF